MKNPRPFSCLIVTVVVLATLAACSIRGPDQRTAKQFYLLRGATAGSGQVTASEQAACSLRVNTPVAAGGFNTTRMAYSTELNRLDYFAYHEWVAAPAKMIASLMEARLDASGLFQFVVTGGSDIRVDLRLDSQLLALQQDFRAGGSSVSLALKVSLVEVGTRRLIDSGTFSYRENAESENAESGAAAANLVVERFIVDLSEFLEAAIAKASCSN